MNSNERILGITRPMVMAIINATPDSFFAESRNTDDASLQHTIQEALDEGADMLDVGGYSSRPGAQEVSETEEIRRVLWAMDHIRRVDPEIMVSVDTFRSAVVRAVVEKYGRIIVNDISSGEDDPHMIETVTEYRLPFIIMHKRGTPKTMQQMCIYDHVAEDVCRYFEKKLEILNMNKIEDIILDPGFGFAKNVEQNFELLANLNRLGRFSLPILSGVSRKTMIWKTLGVTPAEALNGTTALHWESLRQGAKILRAHDIREAVETVKLFEAFSAQQ